MGGENQNHNQPTLLQAGHQNFSNESSSSSNSNGNNNYGYSNNNSNNTSGMSNEVFVNSMMRQVDDSQQQYRSNMQQTLPNLDLNSILGLSGNNSAVPSHLGHHGGHHLVSHLMGAQYNFSQPPQAQPAYSGPTHSVLPSLPHVNNNNNANNMNNNNNHSRSQQHQQQQQHYNQQYNNNNNNMNSNNQQSMMNNNNMNNNGMQGNNGNSSGMMSPPMMNCNNMNGMQGNNGQQEDNHDVDAYSQDVLLLVVEQQRRIYHLEEELQKANEYINKLQDYAKNLEIEKEKHSKKQSRYWTQQEHQKFLQGIEKYGRKDVKAISNFVGSRNPTQVRTHAQKYYAKIEREQRRAHGSDGKRLSISGNSNSSGNESDDDVIGDDNFVSDGSGSGSSGSSGTGSGPTEYENFNFPSKSEEQHSNGNKMSTSAVAQPEMPSHQAQQVV